MLILVLRVFLLSFKRGIGGGSILDIASLVAALLLFIAWAITKDTRTTTIIIILIDGIGTMLTVQKTYKQPQTEAYLQWFTTAIAGLLSIIAVLGHDYILMVYPIYIVVGNACIMLAKYLGTQLQNKL